MMMDGSHLEDSLPRQLEGADLKHYGKSFNYKYKSANNGDKGIIE